MHLTNIELGDEDIFRMFLIFLEYKYGKNIKHEFINESKSFVMNMKGTKFPKDEKCSILSKLLYDYYPFSLYMHGNALNIPCRAMLFSCTKRGYFWQDVNMVWNIIGRKIKYSDSRKSKREFSDDELRSFVEFLLTNDGRQ